MSPNGYATSLRRTSLYGRAVSSSAASGDPGAFATSPGPGRAAATGRVRRRRRSTSGTRSRKEKPGGAPTPTVVPGAVDSASVVTPDEHAAVRRSPSRRNRCAHFQERPGPALPPLHSYVAPARLPSNVVLCLWRSQSLIASDQIKVQVPWIGHLRIIRRAFISLTSKRKCRKIHF